MALPVRFARYDALLDLLVEELVRESLEGADVETPHQGTTPGAGSDSRQNDQNGEQHDEDYHHTRAASAATSSP
jgi:hypothetical protein